MDPMANLLVILFYLSAFYTALGLCVAGIEGINRRLAYLAPDAVHAQHPAPAAPGPSPAPRRAE